MAASELSPGRWPIDAGVARFVRSLGGAFVETVRPSELHVILYAFHSKPWVPKATTDRRSLDPDV
ncbi:MAG: hypothetical protein AB1725_11440, partial [Armatimonadota bacterium]